MRKMKKRFWELLRSPGKVFLIAVVIKLSILGINQLFVVLHLPEIATEADNLSQVQVLLGVILNAFNILLTIFSIIFGFIFAASLIYLVYRLIKPVKR